jgi:hypothetical protein
MHEYSAASEKRSKKFVGNGQVIELFSFGILIKPSPKTLPIHFRKVGLFPFTSTGEHPEHPNPVRGRIAFRRFSSCINYEAHAGTTGKPYRYARR